MKKIVLITVFIIISISLSISVSAGFIENYFGRENGDSNKIYGEIGENTDELLGDVLARLPKEVKDELDNISPESSGTIISLKKTADIFLNSVEKALLPRSTELWGYIGLILLIAVSQNIGTAFGTERSAGIFSIIVRMCAALSVIASAEVMINAATEFTENICYITNGMLPVISFIFLSSGSTVTAAASSSGMLLMITVVENILNYVIIPLTRIMCAVSVAASVSDNGLDELSGIISSVLKYIFVGIMSIFSFILAIQTAVSSSADSLMLKTVKFAVGNGIPIVGGALSEAVNTVAHSLGYIKNTCGAAAIAVLMMMCFPTVITLIMHKLSMMICGTAAKMLGCDAENKLFSSASDISSVLLSFTISISIMFILAVSIVIKTSLAIGA